MVKFLWQRKLAQAGGVASTVHLHAMDLTDVDIRMFAGYGLLVRARRGWYVSPDADPAVVEAVKLGGRLACISALRLRGAPVESDGRVHIEIPGNAVVRAAARDAGRVRVHWTRHPSPGDHALVATSAAWRQARACCGPAQPIA